MPPPDITMLPRRLPYSFEADQQTADLIQHYEDLGRAEAIRNLDARLEDAEERIATNPLGGLPAPRPYPELAQAGRLWVKSGPYWIAYTNIGPTTILAVFHETADIPGRV